MDAAIEVLRKRIEYVERGIEHMKGELGDLLSDASSLRVEIDDSSNLLVSLRAAIAALEVA